MFKELDNNLKNSDKIAILLQNGDIYEKAVEAFNTSLEIRPDVARVIRSRSCALSKLGKESDAKVMETETNGVDTILYDDLIDTYECEIKIAE